MIPNKDGMREYLSGWGSIKTLVSVIMLNYVTAVERIYTKMILHSYNIGLTCQSRDIIVVRSPGTDVLVLLVKCTHAIKQTVLFDIGTENKRMLLDVKYIVAVKGSYLCSVLSVLRSFSSWDTTSVVFRHGHNNSFNNSWEKISISDNISKAWRK